MTPKDIYDRNVKVCKNEIEFVDKILEYQRQMVASDGCHSNTIAPCKPAEPPCKGMKHLAYMEQILQEGEKPMCYKMPSANSSLHIVAPEQPSVEMTQRDFFADRIRQEIARIEQHVLRPQFFMDADDEPRNVLELIEKIKSEDYSLDEDSVARIKKSPKDYWGMSWGIRWGKNKPDAEGFTAARKALKQAAQDVIDEATLSPADKLLPLLQDFRNWKYEVKAEKVKK